MKTLLSFLALILVACSSTPKTGTPAEGGAPGATAASDYSSIVFVSGRYLELEPCGCSFNPVGGFEREYNLLQAWKAASKELLVLNGGTTLYPAKFEAANEKLYRKKARYMYEGIRAMGGEILSPGAEDLYIGFDEMKNLADKSDLELISANLYSKDGKSPLFKTHVERKFGGGKVLIIGLSAPPVKEAKIEATVKNADDVLPAIFKEVDLKDKLVILVTNVSADEREKMLAKYPIHMVLGGKAGEETRFVDQIRGNQLYSNPKPWGRALARLDLKLKFPVSEFFHKETGEEALLVRTQARDEMEGIEKRLKSKKLAATQKKSLEKRYRLLDERVNRLFFVPTAALATSTVYDGTVEFLDAKYSQPRNAMSDLFDKYKKEVETSAKAGEF